MARASRGPAEGQQQLPGFEQSPAGPPLSSEQAAAIRRRSEPLMLSAAAGSGKTSVLVERFVAAVCDDGIAPGAILAITFTDRAAGELRARVRARLLELGRRQAAHDTEAAMVGTFHGFCARLLRSEAVAAGVDPGFAVLEEGPAQSLRRDAFGTAVRARLQEGDEAIVDLLAGYGFDGLASIVQGAFAELRSRGSRSPRLPLAAYEGDPELAEVVQAVKALDALLEAFSGAYRELKLARGAVDFDDLELEALELLERDGGLRAEWSGRFELLMVDEFQDTNRRQLRLLEALERGNLMTVGDELQSIYGFRHADVRIFADRRAQLGPDSTLALTANHRSRPPLIDAVNCAFGERFDPFEPLRAARAGEVERTGEPAVELLLTDTKGWDEGPELATALANGMPDGTPWRQAEARLLAQRVAELVRDGHARPGEVAVLLRSGADVDIFERALALWGLPTLSAVGGFFAQQQVADMTVYLRVLANPLDEGALYQALASPFGNCPLDVLALLSRRAREHREPVWELALELSKPGAEAAVDLAPLRAFCAYVAAEREQAWRRGAAELIERGLDCGGYREQLLASSWGARRLANVHKLMRVAQAHEAAEGRDLRGLLDHLEQLRRSEGREPEAPVPGGEPDAVRLMTVHAAKGLEFPVVCVADLGRRPRLDPAPLLIDGDRLGLRLAGPDGVREPVLDYTELAAGQKAREASEEDRILYVAMTRARERLLLSGSVDLDKWPSSGPGAPPIVWLAPALLGATPQPGLADGIERDLTLPAGGALRVRMNSPLAAAGLRLPGPAGDQLTVEPSPGRQGGTRATSVAMAGSDEGPAVPPVSDLGEEPAGAPAPEAAEEPARERSARAAAETRGDRQPAAPARLSYTALAEHRRCGYRYYLERVLGLPEEREPPAGAGARGLGARERGSLAHELLERHVPGLGQAPGGEEVAAMAATLGLRLSQAEQEEVRALLGGAWEALPASLKALRGPARELPFAFTLRSGGPLIVGVIDLFAELEDGRRLVLDYKTDRVAPGADLAAGVARDYAIQRLVYAIAALRGGAAGVEVVHWYLERPAEPVSVSFQDNALPALEAELEGLVGDIGASRYPVAAEPHRELCLSCPGRRDLCSWPAEATLRERDPG